MNEHPRWHVLDFGAEIHYSARRLPHWFQPGAATFITFRTVDSMPQTAMIRWSEQQKLFLRAHGADQSIDEPSLARLPAALRREFRRFRIASFNKLLDKAYGACMLKRREVAEMVAQTLWSFDNDRYDLDCFVIMPNHVHVLVGIREGCDLRAQCYSWLHYSALRINQLLDSSGPFWQSEPFDHCIRSSEQFEWTRSYIWRNPHVARIRRGEFFYWCSATQNQEPQLFNRPIE